MTNLECKLSPCGQSENGELRMEIFLMIGSENSELTMETFFMWTILE